MMMLAAAIFAQLRWFSLGHRRHSSHATVSGIKPQTFQW
jgi:hypothetical protein